MRKRYLLTFVALASCGNAERDEAVRLATELARQQAALSRQTSDEPERLAAVKQWAGYVSFLGGERDSQQRASDYAEYVTANHGHVTSAILSLDTLPLKHAFAQTIRGEVVSRLRAREQFLSETGDLLRGARDAFPGMGWSRFPSQVRDIGTKLEAYERPEDPFSSALRQLREKYTITDQELTS